MENDSVTSDTPKRPNKIIVIVAAAIIVVVILIILIASLTAKKSNRKSASFPNNTNSQVSSSKPIVSNTSTTGVVTEIQGSMISLLSFKKVNKFKTGLHTIFIDNNHTNLPQASRMKSFEPSLIKVGDNVTVTVTTVIGNKSTKVEVAAITLLPPPPAPPKIPIYQKQSNGSSTLKQ